MGYFVAYAADDASFIIFRDLLVKGETKETIEAFGLISVVETRRDSHEGDRLFSPRRCTFLSLLHPAVGLEAWQLDHRNFCVIPHFHRAIPSALFPFDVEFIINVVSSSLVFLASQGGSSVRAYVYI